MLVPSWVKKIPWNWEWQPTPVFLPGKSHGQRSLAVCSPWGHRDTTEHAHTCNLTRQKNDTERCCIYKIFCWPTLILLVKGVWLADDLESSERGQISIAEVYNREHVWEATWSCLNLKRRNQQNRVLLRGETWPDGPAASTGFRRWWRQLRLSWLRTFVIPTYNTGGSPRVNLHNMVFKCCVQSCLLPKCKLLWVM